MTDAAQEFTVLRQLIDALSVPLPSSCSCAARANAQRHQVRAEAIAQIDKMEAAQQSLDGVLVGHAETKDRDAASAAFVSKYLENKGLMAEYLESTKPAIEKIAKAKVSP